MKCQRTSAVVASATLAIAAVVALLLVAVVLHLLVQRIARVVSAQTRVAATRTMSRAGAKLASVAQRPDTGDSRLLRGSAAEGIAAEYLEARGIAVLARNVRCKAGELDLVCLDGGVLVIIEVRQRSGHEFGGALASVTGASSARSFAPRASSYGGMRVARLSRCASTWSASRDCRTRPRIVWVKDAFRAT